MSELKITVDINAEANIATFKVGGAMTTAEQFLEAYEEVIENPELVQNMHAIWDVSGIDIKSVPIAEIRNLPRAINKVVSRRGAGFKAAIVTTRSGDHMLMKLYLSLLRMISTVNLRVFNSVADAKDWIGTGHKAA